MIRKRYSKGFFIHFLTFDSIFPVANSLNEDQTQATHPSVGRGSPLMTLVSNYKFKFMQRNIRKNRVPKGCKNRYYHTTKKKLKGRGGIGRAFVSWCQVLESE